MGGLVCSSQGHVGIDWHDTGIYSTPACSVGLCVHVCIALSGGVMGRIGDHS